MNELRPYLLIIKDIAKEEEGGCKNVFTRTPMILTAPDGTTAMDIAQAACERLIVLGTGYAYVEHLSDLTSGMEVYIDE